MSGAARPTLFCVPHAGGSADSAYRAWEHDLGDVVRVVPLELAGRGRRAAETSHQSLRAAAVDCAARIEGEARDAPFALFGHSIGGLLGYEIDAVLRDGGQRRPAAVIVAGTPAPLRPRGPLLHLLPDDRFLDAVAALGGLPPLVLEHPAARAFHLDVLRADYGVSERYAVASPAHRLAGPLLVLQGGIDPVTTPEDPGLWRQLADDAVVTRVVPGAEHFFPASHWPETRAAVRGFLAHALA
jgi:surfactin synthase thioesterase subunit